MVFRVGFASAQNRGMFWVGRDLRDLVPTTPATSGDTFHEIRLLQGKDRTAKATQSSSSDVERCGKNFHVGTFTPKDVQLQGSQDFSQH